MPHSDPEPRRASLPHLPTRFWNDGRVIQFITVCVAHRRSLLANQAAHTLILNSWQKAHHWLIGRYVLMPDHLHFFCAPVRLPITPLKRWMEFWRADLTRHWSHEEDKPIWQKDFFDRQLRTGESYYEKSRYICENPVRAGLVRRTEDYPWQGELNPLIWNE